MSAQSNSARSDAHLYDTIEDFPDTEPQVDLIDPEDRPPAEVKQFTREYREHPEVPETQDADVRPLADQIDAAMSVVADEQRQAGAMSPKWDEDAYMPGGNDGSGAWKLGDSAVAPLIAAARGYETMTEETYTDTAKRFGLPRRNTAQGKRIHDSLQRGDVLIMPWFTAQDLVAAERSKRLARPSTTQYRPASPATDDKTGKELKYEFVGGQKTPVGVHPAFPREWVESAPVVLLAEGLLKGDSALTGYLLDAGVSADDLAFDGQGGTEAARRRLTEILDSVPQEKRVLILTIGGVWNWRNNSEWVDLDLKGRDTWVGVDGDVSSNLLVWKACTELWAFLAEKKKTNVSLIAPTIAATDGDKKVGIDDYLASYGNWQGLTSMLSDRLPPMPPSNDLDSVGKYRANPEKGRIEFCEGVCEDPFNPTTPTKGNWVEFLPFAPHFTGAWRLRDDLNGGNTMQVYDIAITTMTPLGPRTYNADLVPNALVKDPETWLERAGFPFPDWPNDRKTREIIYQVLHADARRNGIVMEDMLRRTGLFTNDEGRTAFALNRATITASGWQQGGGAFFRAGSNESKIDMSCLAEADAEEVRVAVREYLTGMKHYTNQVWYLAEIGLASWMHLGNRPHGSFMVVGKPGSGKSTGSRLHTSRYGPRFPRQVIFGKSKAQIADSGQGMHCMVCTLDDYKPNSNVDADRATTEGLEVITRRGYEEEAGRVTKERDELSGNGWGNGRSDLTTPGFSLQGEKVPVLWGRSSYERVLVIQHEFDDYVEGGADAIKRLTRAGHANLATAAFIQYVCGRVDDSGLGIDGWTAAWEARLDKYKSEVVAVTGWDPRFGEIIGSFTLGYWTFLSFALEIGAIDQEAHDALKTFAKQSLAFAMQEHLNKYLPEAEDPKRVFINAIKSAQALGKAHILDDPNDASHFHNVVGFRYQSQDKRQWVCLDAGALAVALGMAVDEVVRLLRLVAEPWEREVPIKGETGKKRKRVDYTRNVKTKAFAGKNQMPVSWVPEDLWEGDEGDEVEDLRKAPSASGDIHF